VRAQQTNSAKEALVHPHPDVVGLVGLIGKIDDRGEYDADGVDEPLGNLPGIIGLLVAWLPIWMGYLLWKSAAAAEAANVTGNENDAIESLGRLKTLFTIQGILAIISIGFTLLWLIIMIVAIIAASSS